MKSFRLLAPRMLVVSVSIALGLCLVFVVFAQSSNTIQGCYSNGNGSLRRVNSPSDCNNSETAISWNITGPQGLQGPAGPSGPQGPPGTGLGVLTGRWVGTVNGVGTQYCGPGNPPWDSLTIVFVQDTHGNLSGTSDRSCSPDSALPVLGKFTGSSLNFLAAGGVVFEGTVIDQNHMNGSLKLNNPAGGPPIFTGTWSIERLPLNP